MQTDSKTLTAESREELLKVMIEHDDDIKWAVRVMSPHDLSRGMLKRNPYNLFVLLPYLSSNLTLDSLRKLLIST